MDDHDSRGLTQCTSYDVPQYMANDAEHMTGQLNTTPHMTRYNTRLTGQKLTVSLEINTELHNRGSKEKADKGEHPAPGQVERNKKR